ncbi:MAG TPA: hypothetical protein DHU81_10540, partial [Hyphomonas sp.]|nr:hypothetical protein [Hyphomonas sp.]
MRGHKRRLVEGFAICGRQALEFVTIDDGRAGFIEDGYGFRLNRMRCSGCQAGGNTTRICCR